MKSRVLGVICKLDVEKAYDHVNWEALLDLLNVGVKWRKWIHTCISTVQFSVLINGSLVDFFGVVFEEDFEVTSQVVQFYKNLYKEFEGWRPFVKGLEFDCIGDIERV